MPLHQLQYCEFYTENLQIIHHEELCTCDLKVNVSYIDVITRQVLLRQFHLRLPLSPGRGCNHHRRRRRPQMVLPQDNPVVVVLLHLQDVQHLKLMAKVRGEGWQCYTEYHFR